MRRRTSVRLLWPALMLLAAPALADTPLSEGSAVAEPIPAEAPPPKPFELRIGVSGWAAAWSGDLDVPGAEVDVDSDLDHAFELGSAGVDVDAELRWNRFSLLAGGRSGELRESFDTEPLDGSLGNFSVDAFFFDPRFGQYGPGVFGFYVPPLPIRLGPAAVDVRVKEAVIDLQAGYRVLSLPVQRLLLREPQADDPRRFDVDVAIGLRSYDLDVRVDVEIPSSGVPDEFLVTPFFIPAPGEVIPPIPRPAPPALVQALETVEVRDVRFDDLEYAGWVPLETGVHQTLRTDAQWIDPVIAVRMRLGLTPCLSVGLDGDVGGFGIGSASDVAWRLRGDVTWRVTEHWDVQLGYEWQGLQRDHGPLLLDQRRHGPRVGVGWRF